MRRSLHMKLVLIMVLLIVSLMVVVGAFLMNSVTGYYINDFYSQMSTAFGEENVEFVRDLRTAAEGEEDGGAMIGEVLSAYVGVLGVDGRIRNYYVLDGTTGQYLTGSADAPQGGIAITPNISAALLGEEAEHWGVKAYVTPSMFEGVLTFHGEEYHINQDGYLWKGDSY